MKDTLMKRALLIAYHYPPVRLSSGVQRTLAFSRYLPESDWQPMVLTAHPRAYDATSTGQLKDIPDDMVLSRAQVWDTARHFSIAGRYLDWMALPDRWVSWCPGAVLAGLGLIRRYRPRVIFSTYPIATAHLIALALHKLTGLAWVADFRDSMTEDFYPREKWRRKFFLWIENKVVHACSRAIFTTPGAIRMYRQRYPHIPEERWVLIPNGYNEEIFAEVEGEIDGLVERGADEEKKASPILLIHSGLLYPSERDPRAFFSALATLKNKNTIDASGLKIILRATGHDDIFRPMLQQLDIEDLVELAPGIGYREALTEMLEADGLLIFQASNCNHQIPAKLYEYFRAQKPVLALTDPGGDTATTLREAGLECIVPLDDAKAIAQAMTDFLQAIGNGTARLADRQVMQRYSRQYAAKVLAELFDAVTSSAVLQDELQGE